MPSPILGPQDFDALTIGSVPAGWTNIGTAHFAVLANGAVSASHAFGEASPSGSDDVCLYTAMSPAGDAEVYYDFTAVAVDSTHYTTVGVLFRADSTFQNGYLFFFDAAGSTDLLKKQSGGAYSLIAGQQAFPPLVDGSRYSLRVRLVGSTLSAKLWAYGTTEPGSWMFIATDSGNTFAGTMGFVGLRAGGVGSTAAVSVDNLAITGLDVFVVARPFVAPSGTAIGVVFQDQDGNPLDISSIDPAVARPTYTVNGGSPITLAPGLYGQGHPGGAAVPAYFPAWLSPLPRDTPAVVRIGVGEGPFGHTDEWISLPGDPSTSYSGRPMGSTGGSGFANFDCEGIFPGTFDLYMRWPTDATQSNAVSVTVQDNVGGTLGSFTVDQSVATAADITDSGFAWKRLGSVTVVAGNPTLYVKVHGNAGKVSVDAIRWQRTSPDAAATIAPTDVVSVSIANAWGTVVVPNSIATIPASTTTAVNHSGGQMVPTVTSATMPVGYNINPDAPSQPVIPLSNLASRAFYPTEVDGVYQGPPATLPNPSADSPLVTPGFDDHGKGKLMASAPNGYYTVLWDLANSGASPSDFVLSGDGNTDCNEVVGLRDIGHATNNKRVFNLQAHAKVQYAPTITLHHLASGPISGGSYPTNAVNVRVYPPDPADSSGLTPWASPPRVHPKFAAMLGTGKSVRVMDPLGTNSVYIHEFDDVNIGKSVSAQIVRIEDPGVADPWFDPANWTIAKITFATPHGLPERAVFTLSGCGTITRGNAGPPLALDGVHNNAHVVSPTVIYAQVERTGGIYPINQVLTPSNARMTASWGGGYPFSYLIDYANANGNDFWLNLPTAASDACITSMANALAGRLHAGSKVYLEYSNEVWNSFFLQQQIVQTLAYRYLKGGGTPNPGHAVVDLDYTPGYVAEAARMQSIFVAAWVAAGRSAQDVVRVLAGFGSTISADAIGFQAVAQGVTFDAWATAPYVGNWPLVNGTEVDLASISGMMTPAQSLDWLELVVMYGGWAKTFYTDHRAVLDSHGLAGVKLVGYEGLWDFITPYDSGANRPARAHAIFNDPRMYAITIALLKSFQDAGCTAFHSYYLYGPYGSPSWSVWNSWNQQAGTGDPSENPDPEAVDSIRSQPGGAIGRYNALLAPPGPATTYTAAMSPSTITVGGTVTATIAPDGLLTGTCTGTPSGSAASGLSPITRTFSNSSDPQSASWTPTVAGTLTITWTNSGSLANPANGTVTVTPASSPATTYTISGPSSGVVNVASTNFTVTPDGTFTGQIILSPSGGGLSTPITLTFSGGSSPMTFSITPTAAGVVTLTPTNSGSLANPTAAHYTATSGGGGAVGSVPIRRVRGFRRVH